ncbi:hypothetical protein MMC13_008432 [Lambiella insularis]|nr:hypothetical protein [Lambiella insularis]
MACGFSRTGVQIIVFSGFSGIAASFCLPSAVGLINEVFPSGRARNVAFASMGAAQPLGFGVGLTLGGILTGTIGWQWGFYIAAITNLIMLVVAAWQLPKSLQDCPVNVWQRLVSDIDWIGALTVSISVAMLSYVVGTITGSPSSIRSPTNITLLVAAFMFLLAFIFWIGRQERLNRPALIPNSLWRDRVFSCVCINVFCIWAAFNAFDQYLSFYFQNVQSINPLSTALYFLPAPVSGALTNIVVGLVVHRVRGDWIVVLTTVACAIGSILMAVADPGWSYWSCAFVANFLNPIGADGIFTVSNLLITSMFPSKTQGVAGGVFNTISQTGKSVGMALTALIANEVTASSLAVGKQGPEALLIGYRAAFWFCAALIVTSLFISVWGLKEIGVVGGVEKPKPLADQTERNVPTYRQ